LEYKGDVGVYVSGTQVPIPQCGFYITPPKVKAIIQYGETRFFTQVSMVSDIAPLVKPLREGKSELEHVGDFQILLGILADPQGSNVKNAFSQFFDFCCPGFEVTIDRKAVHFWMGKDEERVRVGQLNPFNYPHFADTVRELFLPPNADEGEVEYNIDKNSRASRLLLEKMKKNRERLRKLGQKDDKTNSSVFALQLSVLSIGMHVDIGVFLNYTPFQLYDAFNRYILKDAYDTFQRIRCIPFADTSDIEEPESWYTNLYGKEHLDRNKNRYNSMAGFQSVVGSK